MTNYYKPLKKDLKSVERTKITYPVGYIKRDDKYIFRIFDFHIESAADTYESMIIRMSSILNYHIEQLKSSRKHIPEPSSYNDIRVNEDVTILLVEVEI